MNYTKGEWKVRKNLDDQLFISCANYSNRYPSLSEQYPIARIDMHQQETEANANLIAAAPKLDRYREYVDAKIDIGEIPLRFDEFEEITIAKAKGG